MNFNFNPADVFGLQQAFEGSEVQQDIGKMGYFGDSLNMLQKGIAERILNTLDKVHIDGEPYPYQFSGADHNHAFALFLPAEKVAQIPEKLRPVRSWQELIKLSLDKPICYGDFAFAPSIKIRIKGKPSVVLERCITGVTTEAGVLEYICLGPTFETPGWLFQNYEIYSNTTNEWVPIGVPEDKDKDDAADTDKKGSD